MTDRGITWGRRALAGGAYAAGTAAWDAVAVRAGPGHLPDGNAGCIHSPYNPPPALQPPLNARLRARDMVFLHRTNLSAVLQNYIGVGAGGPCIGTMWCRMCSPPAGGIAAVCRFGEFLLRIPFAGLTAGYIPGRRGCR